MFSVHVIGSKNLGGAERFCLRLIGALRERGESASVLVRRGGGIARAGLEDIEVHQAPMRTVWDPWSRWKVSHALHSLRPDIVQTYMGRATRLTHIPPRGPVHVARLGGYYALHGYLHAHAWVGNTQGLCDYMVRGGLPAKRVFKIGNFVDLPRAVGAEERRRLRQQWSLSDDDYVFVTCGRFVPVKGHEVLLEAFARLPGQLGGRPLRLMMLGDGGLGGALRAQAERLGIGDRVLWLGWQPDPTPFYDLADQVVFPSREEETLGNVILEAWAHRKPIVVTRFRGAREVTRHEADAWQVPCDDAAALAEGMQRVAVDEAMAAALAGQGYARVGREFSRAAIAEQYIALYHELVRQRGRES